MLGGMATADLRDVELVATGRHAASTGMTDVTLSDLESMLAAAQDGTVDHPPVKLGHRSELNNGIGDGAPAYGWVRPTRIEERPGRHVLIGDLLAMPAKLAEAAPTAYRRRSVEIGWQVKSAAGKVHRAVLAGVALLGVQAPAVKGLADVLALYSDHAADDVTVVTMFDGATDDALTLLSELAAAVNTDTAHVHDTPTQIPDDGGVTDPSPKGATVPEQQMSRGDLRKMIGASTDDELQERLDAILNETAEGGETAAVEPAPVVPVSPEPVKTPEPAVAPTLPAAAALSGVVQVSQGQWDRISALAAWAEAKQKAEVLDGAVHAGRIAPAETALFSAQYDKDPEGVTSLLSSLQPRFAVSELGADKAPEGTADEAAIQEYINAPIHGIK